MRVPTIIYADLIRGMDDKVFTQATNVAMLGRSSVLPMQCQMRIGDMAFRLAASRHSIRLGVALSPLGGNSPPFIKGFFRPRGRG